MGPRANFNLVTLPPESDSLVTQVDIWGFGVPGGARARKIFRPIPGERGQQHSFLQKLVRGMPARLQKCKDNLYGRCGK